MRKHAILVSLTILLVVTFANAEMLYNFIDLGTHPGGVKGIAQAVNNYGQVVGYGANNSNGDRALLFDSTGNGNNIDLRSSIAGWSVAWSINDLGQIVGYSGGAILFDPSGNGNNIDLGALPGGNGGYAYSINNSGKIVGMSHYSAGHHATLFDPTGNGNNIDLGALGGTPYSGAWSINNSGQIVGWAYTGAWSHATLFDPTGNGNNVDLGTLSGGGNSVAYSINDLGQIVGETYDTQARYHATLFDITGKGNNVDLGELPGGTDSRAYSINNSGKIVGWSKSSTGDWHATLFDPTGNGLNIDLNNLIDPALGYTLVDATCINDYGWIVGHAWTASETMHAYLLIPVSEPAPFLLHTPNGSESISTGSIYTIDWSSTGSITNVLIEYSTNNGGIWSNVSIVPNTGTYNWLIPAANSNQCLVRISDASNPAIYDTSNSVFAIRQNNPSEYPTLYEVLGGSAPAITESGRDFVTRSLPDANVVAFILLEAAGYSNENIFGIYSAYDPQQKLQLFAGNDNPADTAIVQFNAAAGTAMNLHTGQTAAIDKFFGFYLTAPQDGGTTYYTDLTRNPDSSEHGLIYNTSGFAGVIEGDPDTVIAFEDLLGLGDKDYNDMVVGITNAVPLPGSSPHCTKQIPGDINGDCMVNLADFAIMVSHWLECNLDPQEACGQ